MCELCAWLEEEEQRGLALGAHGLNCDWRQYGGNLHESSAKVLWGDSLRPLGPWASLVWVAGVCMTNVSFCTPRDNQWLAKLVPKRLDHSNQERDKV